jgi:Do/DeqQ family serine protease
VVPSSPAQITLSYAPVVKRVAPAVVNVYAAKVVENRNPLLDDPIFRRFFGAPGGPREQIQRSLGSGVMVDPAGLIVTNNHVIEGADQVKVSLADKREFEAEIVLKDARSDLAVLRIGDKREKFAAIDLGDSDALEVGDVVLAIGNPFGVGQTVTHGIVSAVARTQIGITDYQFFIQTDAAINPGNSGGALVALDGRLVGINTAIFSRSGGSMGIGFAIPVSTAKMVLDQIVKSGSVTRGWIGVEVQEITPPVAESFKLGTTRGALIAGVLRGGPADKAGVKPGDVLVEVQGKPVADPAGMLNLIAALAPGQSAKVKLKRQGQDVDATVTVGRRPKPQARAE